MPRPVCFPCRAEMRPAINGVHVAFGAKVLRNEEDRPYQIWVGDAWRCPNCNATVVTRYAHEPSYVHYNGPPPASSTYIFVPEKN